MPGRARGGQYHRDMLEQRIQQNFIDSADLKYQAAESLSKPVALACKLFDHTDCDTAPSLAAVACKVGLTPGALSKRFIAELGVNPRLFAFSVGAAQPDFVESLGADAEYVLGPSMWEPEIETPGNAEFVAAYRQKFNRDPDYHSAAGYSACLVLEQAVTNVGAIELERQGAQPQDVKLDGAPSLSEVAAFASLFDQLPEPGTTAASCGASASTAGRAPASGARA